MDAGSLETKACKTLVYTCNECFYCSINTDDFNKHICIKKNIDRHDYIRLKHQLNILEQQQQHYIDVIDAQVIKISVLESIIDKFGRNINQDRGTVAPDQQIKTVEEQPDSTTVLVPVTPALNKDPHESIDLPETASVCDAALVNQNKEVIKGDMTVVDCEDQQEHKKVIFRSIRGMEIRDESTEAEINKIYERIELKEMEENGDLYSLLQSECEEKMTSLMNAIRTQKQYAPELRELRQIRLKLIKFLELPQYVVFLNQHIEQMTEIFLSRMDQKKVKGIIKTRVLLPLELRLIDLKGFETVPMDTNEISLLKQYLRYRWGFGKELKIFDKEQVINLYSCYNIALFNVVDYIKIILPNRYGFNNLIYLDIQKSIDEDPFSFYYLEQIGNEGGVTRNWKMDCRLDDLVGDIATSVLEFSVTLYRKIYHAIYHDNVYRSQDNDTQILEYEGEQIIQNIVILSDTYNFNMRIRQIIKEKCTYIPTKNDKFNLYSDDPINRRRFTGLKKWDGEELKKETLRNIRQLFDTIEESQLADLYNRIRGRI